MSSFSTPELLSTLLFGFALFVFAPCLGMVVYTHRAACARYQEGFPRNLRMQERFPLLLLSESLPHLREKLRLDTIQDATLMVAITRYYRWRLIVRIVMFVCLLLLIARFVAS